MTFQRSGIDADPDRTAVVLGGLDHFPDASGRADITGVDAQTGGPRFGGLDGAFVVKMDVGDDRHRAFGDDKLQRAGAVFIWGRDADDIGPGNGGAPDLFQRRLDVRGDGIGHGLHRNWRITANRNFAHHDLARFTAINIAPWTNWIVRHEDFRSEGYGA